MNHQSEILNQLVLSDSLVNDYLHILLKPSIGKYWLQKIANLLLQITGCDALFLCTYIDNAVFLASKNSNLSGETFFKNISRINEENTFEKPYYLDNYYIVPLSQEGCLQILWNKNPKEVELEKYLNLFSFLLSALNIRSDLISKTRNLLHIESLSRIEKIIS